LPQACCKGKFQCGGGYLILVIPSSSRYLEELRIKRTVRSELLEKIRFKELSALRMSKTSKNRQVFMKEPVKTWWV
jgi:hypothetical protein